MSRNTTTLGDVVIDLEARDVSMSRGLDALENKLRGFERSLKGFSGISKLAFGFGVGGAAFTLAHEGLMNLIGGFADAAKQGGDFFEVIEHGTANLLGLKSQLDINAERLASHSKRLEENQRFLEQVAKAAQDADHAYEDFLRHAASQLPAFLGVNQNRFDPIQGPEGHVSSLEQQRDAAQIALRRSPQFENAQQLEQRIPGLRQRVNELEKGSFSGSEFREFKAAQAELKKAEDELRRLTAVLAPSREKIRKMQARIDELSAEYKRAAEFERSLRFSIKNLDEAQAERARIAAEEAARAEQERAEADAIRRRNDPTIGIREAEERARQLFERGFLLEDEYEAEQRRLRPLELGPDLTSAGQQRPQFLALEEMARRIQQAAVPTDDIAKQQLAEQKKTNGHLAKLESQQTVAVLS